MVTDSSSKNPVNTIKFIISYGGKILPRHTDGKLRYHGGETRVITINRSITVTDLLIKLGEVNGSSVSLRCQLPGEDIDTLISVVSDEDLSCVIEEYDIASQANGSPKIRGFLYPPKIVNKISSPPSATSSKANSAAKTYFYYPHIYAPHHRAMPMPRFATPAPAAAAATTPHPRAMPMPRFATPAPVAAAATTPHPRAMPMPRFATPAPVAAAATTPHPRAMPMPRFATPAPAAAAATTPHPRAMPMPRFATPAPVAAAAATTPHPRAMPMPRFATPAPVAATATTTAIGYPVSKRETTKACYHQYPGNAMRVSSRLVANGNNSNFYSG
ncbi:hypothetical protein IFM89_038374 [Coptis chinensis]|uniref:PB1 domain-containing protein n=1 Tax=Coptis chinensis TaxID=261450 RepID=A0A835LFP9_9MAGN|nr:hypothetical protein IFM89_038374 [Coptis chinensis]